MCFAAVKNFSGPITIKGRQHPSRKEDVDRILALMGLSQVVPGEVLVDSISDACVRLRGPRRLNQALDQFKASGVVPPMHTNATLNELAEAHARAEDRAG